MHGIQGSPSAFAIVVVTANRHRADDPAVATLAMTLDRVLADAPTPGEPWMPDDLAWDALTRLAEQAKPLASVEARTFADNIRQSMNEAPRYSPDTLLLDSILDNCFGSGKTRLTVYLADKAFTCLSLPDLEMLEPGEVQPNSRTFNSVLPSLALGVHEYGPFGRTLLWHGARHLLAGPSGDASESRVEALQKVIFSHPNKAHLGDTEVPTIQEFVAELDLLDSREGIYEGTRFDSGLPPIIV